MAPRATSNINRVVFHASVDRNLVHKPSGMTVSHKNEPEILQTCTSETTTTNKQMKKRQKCEGYKISSVFNSISMFIDH